MSIITDLKNQIAVLQEQIASIQEDCSHPTSVLIKKHRSNTGNYDPSVDCYWTEFHCQLCEKHWREDGSK